MKKLFDKYNIDYIIHGDNALEIMRFEITAC